MVASAVPVQPVQVASKAGAGSRGAGAGSEDSTSGVDSLALHNLNHRVLNVACVSTVCAFDLQLTYASTVTVSYSKSSQHHEFRLEKQCHSDCTQMQII